VLQITVAVYDKSDDIGPCHVTGTPVEPIDVGDGGEIGTDTSYGFFAHRGLCVGWLGLAGSTTEDVPHRDLNRAIAQELFAEVEAALG